MVFCQHRPKFVEGIVTGDYLAVGGRGDVTPALLPAWVCSLPNPSPGNNAMNHALDLTASAPPGAPRTFKKYLWRRLTSAVN